MTGRVRLSPVEQGLVRGPVGPGDGQSHPLSRAGFADEQPLVHRTASLEHDHETLARQRVERVSNNDRAQSSRSFGRTCLMTGPLGPQKGEER